MNEIETKTGVIIVLAGALVATAIIAYNAIEMLNLFTN